MGRAILAVLAGYFTMFVLVFCLFTAAFLMLGTSGSFKPGSFEVSTTWSVISIVVSLLAAIAGGFICAMIARSGTPVKVLAGLVFVLGLLFAIPSFTSNPPVESRPEEMSNMEAMSKAVTPPAMALLNPFLGAGGALIGGLRKLRSGKPATPA